MIKESKDLPISFNNDKAKEKIYQFGFNNN